MIYGPFLEFLTVAATTVGKYVVTLPKVIYQFEYRENISYENKNNSVIAVVMVVAGEAESSKETHK